MKDRSYLEAAAAAVEREAMENPGMPIPVDPDVEPIWEPWKTMP